MLATSPPQPIESDLIAQATSGTPIRHGFFTRHGGVSQGIYQGLNVGLGSNDERDAVIENRVRVCGHFNRSIDDLATPHQIHSPDVVVATGSFGDERPKADAVVTNIPGVVIGVLTADCGPILFCDPDAGVVGAAHAGWRGALTGVLENTIAAMENLGADRRSIRASLGPSISVRNYEVGPEFVERFTDADPDNQRFFADSDRAGHAMFDLPAYTLHRLKRAGVAAESTGHCTYEDEAAFFSYRRTTHRGEPDYGRQIAAIAITE
ncbi:peptidoglycan editing factor PgeF [Georhizobium profundi]|jgi:polyphenol oxidase|uniref:Purine nucleoside phosphorylase n=1 Tax=Georhizobium profundi TaxID=2341112 RepID=A0A3S9B2S1_9HYPH|nr:peptidoglycan editing factor PgeF [Georhizobium profundi]AZN71171.1 peptidoglycan editing factor PgeF [Georhizobium profundi]GLQ37237.1 laccase domain protein [Rhizobium albus]